MQTVMYFFMFICATLPLASDEVERNYFQELNDSEMEDIHYILTILANKPLAKLVFYKASLERAGDRINHLHPLRFLEGIFMEEETKVAIRNIRKRSWVWKDFVGGFDRSFKEETAKSNLSYEQVTDFASRFTLCPDDLMPTLQNEQWEEFIVLLIQLIPREGDDDRYDF